MSADPVVIHCRSILSRGSRSYSWAAALLGRQVRDPGSMLYAWCRFCDDRIDGQSLGHGLVEDLTPSDRHQRIEALKDETLRAFEGLPVTGLEFRAIGRVVSDFGVPRHLPLEFLSGLEMDIEPFICETIDAVRAYSRLVAGVVAVMVGHILGIRDTATLRGLERIGTATQLTNIARDIMDDARLGRIYLPRSWMVEARLPVSPAAVLDRANRPALVEVVNRLLDDADDLYQEGDADLTGLSFRHRWAITAARLLYQEIGQLIRSRGVDAWNDRAYVNDATKTVIMVNALAVAITKSSS